MTVLVVGRHGHVEYDQLWKDVSAAEIAAFVARYPVSCATAHNQAWLRIVRARTIARRRLARHGSPPYNKRTRQLQRVIFNRLVFEEWIKLA